MSEPVIPSFFFDTADTEAIKRIWEKLSKKTSTKSCLGITTNPNALAKVNCHTIEGLVQLVKTMSNTMDSICGGGSLIYVQVPNSCMTIDKIVKWAEFISKLDTGKSKIALKIPHFSYILRNTSHPIFWNTELFGAFKNLYLNVTGISDCGTIIKALGYENISYASIIPGRMEEVGINANEHLKYLCKQKFKSHQAVITEACEPLKGLEMPSTTERFQLLEPEWDLFEVGQMWDEFPEYWNNQYQVSETPEQDYCPETTDKNIALSKQFFEQMDSLGSKLHEDFLQS